jgi:hypothetical protein
MDLTVRWRNPTHFLLAGASVELSVDGNAQSGTVSPGRATFTIAEPWVEATLTVRFVPGIGGSTATTLAITQTFTRAPSPIGFGLGPDPTTYVTPAATGASSTHTGRNPLVASYENAGQWTVSIDTTIVDLTALQPAMFRFLNRAPRVSPSASVRLLARTDGSSPLHYITATPQACASADPTDVLCFLTPPQRAPKDVDSDELLLPGAAFDAMAGRIAVFLADGQHASPMRDPRSFDHFTPASGPGAAPNVVLSRGWERALVESGKHVALVLPAPSESGFGTIATTGTLPAQLRGVHAALGALGDIAATSPLTSPAPRLGIGGHSNAGDSLFAAVRNSAADAFSEVWMFEAQGTAKHLPDLAKATKAQFLFAGFSAATVGGPFAAASAPTSPLTGRVRRLPDPAPADNASPATLVAASSRLAHALEPLTAPSPPSAWAPGAFTLANGEHFAERFEVLHQHIVQGNDASGEHYLTRALKSSVFR